jgi:hypothetical protein
MEQTNRENLTKEFNKDRARATFFGGTQARAHRSDTNHQQHSPNIERGNTPLHLTSETALSEAQRDLLQSKPTPVERSHRDEGALAMAVATDRVELPLPHVRVHDCTALGSTGRAAAGHTTRLVFVF